MSEPTAYGIYYFCIGIPRVMPSNSDKIYAWADEIEITPDGSLVLKQNIRLEQDRITLALPAGRWSFVFLTAENGNPVSVEHGSAGLS